MPLPLIIFDCDGTLVDTEPLQNMAVAQILAEEGLPQYDAGFVHAHFVGVKFSVALAKISAETGHVFPPDMSRRYVERVRELYPTHFRKVAGAEECVAEAQARGFKTCVGSNGQRDNVLESLTRAGLKKYFPDAHIFTAIQVENPKPAPDLFLLAAKTMGAAPASCIVIEDSVPGATAGRAAGMRTIGFTGTNEDKKSAELALKNAGADEVFATPLSTLATRYSPKKSFVYKGERCTFIKLLAMGSRDGKVPNLKIHYANK